VGICGRLGDPLVVTELAESVGDAVPVVASLQALNVITSAAPRPAAAKVRGWVIDP
jgi:hypothetical protein